MFGEILYQATDYFRPFPALEDVFGKNAEEHGRYLLPLASVDLARLRDDWSGWLHFVIPIEPHDGVVGEDTSEYHNHLCQENWIGYKIVDGKYRLACDFRYFLKAHAEMDVSPVSPQTREALENHYVEVRRQYDLSRQHYLKYGCLHSPYAEPDEQGVIKDRPLELGEVGGVTCGGNWAEDTRDLAFGKYVDSSGEEWTTAAPKTEDGRDFCFIGELLAFHYLHATDDSSVGGCRVVLFYDPVDNVALTTFDWS